MKVAFLGDFVLSGDKIDNGYFDEIENYFIKNNIVSCVNLESPFVEEEMVRIKEKVTLKANAERVADLKHVHPFLINLSNNHINDYGVESCKLTQKILYNNNYQFFGVGYSFETESNIYIDDSHKVIYLAYVTRSSDFTGSKLFASNDFIGGFDFDVKQLKKIKRKYFNYKIIVNIHWGIENIKYPEIDKCNLAREIIDAGADIIIGHHPHIIQPYELYKGKYIFYSIGNFYFPEIEFELQGQLRKLKILNHQKKGIIPIFKIAPEELEIVDILHVENMKQHQKVVRNYSLKRINTGTYIYMIKSKTYRVLKSLIKSIVFNLKLLLSNPNAFLSKLLNKIRA